MNDAVYTNYKMKAFWWQTGVSSILQVFRKVEEINLTRRGDLPTNTNIHNDLKLWAATMSIQILKWKPIDDKLGVSYILQVFRNVEEINLTRGGDLPNGTNITYKMFVLWAINS